MDRPRSSAQGFFTIGLSIVLGEHDSYYSRNTRAAAVNSRHEGSTVAKSRWYGGQKWQATCMLHEPLLLLLLNHLPRYMYLNNTFLHALRYAKEITIEGFSNFRTVFAERPKSYSP